MKNKKNIQELIKSQKEKHEETIKKIENNEPINQKEGAWLSISKKDGKNYALILRAVENYKEPHHVALAIDDDITLEELIYKSNVAIDLYLTGKYYREEDKR